MKVRLVVALVLSTFGLALVASAAVAQKPIPGIQQTGAWKSLKKNVSFLQARRDQPASGARKASYRQTLTKRRANADTKVKALFKQTKTRIARADDRWQRQEIKRIRSSQKRQVQKLQASSATRVMALQASQATAVHKVTNRFASKINRLTNQRDKLRRKLAKTTNPDKRAALTRQIKRLQGQINDLADDRQDRIDNINDRYSSRISAVNDLYNAKIARVKSRAANLIEQANRAWRKTFRIQLRAAKTRRDSQFGQVKTLAQRGSGYIDSMPTPEPAP